MKNKKVNGVHNLIIENLDIVYIIVATVVLVLDIFTASPAFEALAFILIVIGFIFSVLPNKKNLKDERVNYLKLFSGYIGFMVTTIIVWLFSVAYRYIGFSLSAYDLLRYIVLFMYFIFTLAYSISKRKM